MTLGTIGVTGNAAAGDAVFNAELVSTAGDITTGAITLDKTAEANVTLNAGGGSTVTLGGITQTLAAELTLSLTAEEDSKADAGTLTWGANGGEISSVEMSGAGEASLTIGGNYANALEGDASGLTGKITFSNATTTNTNGTEVNYKGSSDVTGFAITTGAGADTIEVGAGSGTITTGAGLDTISLGEGDVKNVEGLFVDDTTDLKMTDGSSCLVLATTADLAVWSVTAADKSGTLEYAATQIAMIGSVDTSAFVDSNFDLATA